MMGKNPNQIRITGMLFLFMVAVLFQSCDKNSTDPGSQDLQLSESVTQGLVSSWQTIHSISSVEDVKELLSGDAELEEGEFGGITSVNQIRTEFNKLKNTLETAVLKNPGEFISNGDSLLWFIDWTDPISGVSVRKALYYNTDTGVARYYEAIYQFPNQLRLAYDSTEVRADLNFTLNDASDDKLLSVYKKSLFKEGFFVEKIEATAEATDYDPNNQVTGAIATNHVWYGDQSRLDQLTQQLEINPDQSGQISERLDYRDGTFLQKTINFYDDYTGDFSETWRDGTMVSGTFDRLEDDNHAQVTRTVDFPNGYRLDQIQQLADVTLNLVDSSSHVLLNEKHLFASGRLDTSQLVVDEYYENGVKKTNLLGNSSDGSEADLLITHFPEYQDVEGNFSGPNGYYSLIHATLYTDGSGELWLTVYASEAAYQNGEAPLASIYIHFNPDGSGNGEITENEIKYNVQVQPSGEMLVQDDRGHSKTVSGY